MGICGGKNKSNQPKKLTIKIGGAEHGTCKWLILNGAPVGEPKITKGWEMKFNVDDNGIVTGYY